MERSNYSPYMKLIPEFAIAILIRIADCLEMKVLGYLENDI